MDATLGRQDIMDPNKFYYPKPGILGATLSAIANSRLLGSVRRAILSHLPFVRLESDVRDIVYLNWVVPSELVRAHIPRGVQILEVGGGDDPYDFDLFPRRVRPFHIR